MAYIEADGSEAVAAGGLATVLAPQTAIPATTDTPVAFTQRVRGYVIQNNTAGPIYRALDAPAGLGAVQIAAGAMLQEPAAVTVLHLYAPAATTVNGPAAGIAVEGKV